MTAVGWGARLLLAVLSVAVFIADQATKKLAASALAGSDPVTVLPVFELRYVENPGAAFGLFASAGAAGRYGLAAFSIVATLGLAWWLLLYRRITWTEAWAAALLLGGAAGNLLDRVMAGRVIDFLYFHIGPYGFPAFNLADASLSAGVMLLLAEVFVRMRAKRRLQS